ncbi:YfhG lipoprotein [Izhakiella capsodis]|uniref:YfhG lipoprotein n=1 Tax=Izhakiella capsodis TaxID=1367852 RepID=A0A1I4WCY8_9GAMM|nr:hypothetical protein [Izhakiella capsodis]SFN11654.1 YfhG lipoprotein [Izhakiella capsodis]
MNDHKMATWSQRPRAAILSLLALSACRAQPQGEGIASLPAPAASEINVMNSDNIPCNTVWATNNNHVLNRPRYWLHVLDCAAGLAPADARAEAGNWPQSNWQSAFKQSILIDNGNITPLERRAGIRHLDAFRGDYPLAVRPLIPRWNDRQAAEWQLAEEHSRYTRLLQKSASQLDVLRHQQRVLKQVLAQTQRKVNSLADIERQLSTRRRAAERSDNDHNRDGPDAAIPDNATGGKP